MQYDDFEVKVRPAGGQEYEIDIRSASGEKTCRVRFPYDHLALESRLQALEIALLKSGGSRRDIRFQEQETVEDFGKTLFDVMLGGEVRDLYRRSRQTAAEEGRGLRLRLRVEAPELASLPWEYMYDQAEGDYVCLSAETPMIRYLAMDRPPAPLAVDPPIRVLGMVASPKDRSTLNVEREKQRIERATERLRADGLLHWEWLPGGGWRDLQRAMREGPWHVFHFVGHGGFDPATQEGLLAMVDDNGGSFRISATQLGRLLADHQSLRLAVLNSCEGARGSDTNIFSSTASVLMRRGLPAVVAMQYEITDRAAIEFSQVFYEDIADGLAVDTAVTEARKAMSLSLGGSLEWGTPVLHMRAPDGQLFDLRRRSRPGMGADTPVGVRPVKDGSIRDRPLADRPVTDRSVMDRPSGDGPAPGRQGGTGPPPPPTSGPPLRPPPPPESSVAPAARLWKRHPVLTGLGITGVVVVFAMLDPGGDSVDADVFPAVEEAGFGADPLVTTPPSAIGSSAPGTPPTDPALLEPPTYGLVALAEGFLPDPHEVALYAGGAVQVAEGACTFGRVNGVPDVHLQFTGRGTGSLHVYARGVDDGDITLLIRHPDGSWLCDDDSLGSLQPLVSVPSATSGLYHIWVGTMGTEFIESTLYISEVDPDPGAPAG